MVHVPLATKDEIRYLGTDIGDLNGSTHCYNRISASTRAFYGLHGITLKYPGIKPQIALDIFNICVNSILKYGCASIYCRPTSKYLEKLNKVQSKLIVIKQCLGLRMCCHTIPLLKAINILPISLNIHLESLDLLRKCILNNSLARYFYCEERHKIVKTLSG